MKFIYLWGRSRCTFKDYDLWLWIEKPEMQQAHWYFPKGGD
jgi:hypothetical protein